jgi:hypothetical protein
MVHTFESVVNEHLHFELEYKEFTQNEIKTILRKFTIDEKVGWFLKILCGKDYTKGNSKNWYLRSVILEPVLKLNLSIQLG